MINNLINPYIFGGFSPLSIPNAIAWWDASILTDPDGTILATWTDLLGNVMTASGNIIVNTNTQNGLRGVFMDANTGGTTNVSSTDFTVHCVLKITNTSSFFRRAMQGRDDNWLIGPYSGNWKLYDGGFITGSATASGAIILSATQDNGTLTEFFENNVSKGTNVPSTNPGRWAFSAPGLFNESLVGWILEATIYDRVLNSTELGQLQTYFSTKWAI